MVLPWSLLVKVSQGALVPGRYLAQGRDARAVWPLIAALKDEDEDVGKTAAEALDKIANHQR